VTSSAFAEEQAIPVKYPCDGENISPPLKWSGMPAQAVTLALIADDPDAGSGTFVHWVAFNFAGNMTELAEGVSGKMPASIVEGRNGAGAAGYRGPCPPSGNHRYFFKIYALDTTLNLGANATKQDVERAMAGHILAQGELMGRYQRQ